MGIFASLRGSRIGAAQETLPVSDGVSSSPKRRWSNLMPLLVAIVVLAEIAFLGRLDVASNVAIVDSWADLFFRSLPPDDLGLVSLGSDRVSESESCEEWLERHDAVVYSRDFGKEPILVSGSEKVWYFSIGISFILLSIFWKCMQLDSLFSCSFYSSKKNPF